MGSISGIDAAEEKNPLTLPGIELRFISCPARILVPIQTELSRLFINVRIITKRKLLAVRTHHGTNYTNSLSRSFHYFNKVDLCPLCTKSFNNSKKSSILSRLSVTLQNNNVYEKLQSRLFSKNLVAFYGNQEVRAS